MDKNLIFFLIKANIKDMGKGKIKIQLIDRDLTRRFGLYLTLPHREALAYVNRGQAVYFQPPEPVKVQDHQLVSTIEILPEHKAAETATRPFKKYPDILWLQDTERVGGSELSSRQTVRVGRSLGFDIGIMTPINFDWVALNKAKLLILNNIWFFNGGQMNQLKRVLFEYQIPYVKYEHDSRHVQDQERVEFARKLFWHSKCNFFISPAHLKYHQRHLPQMSKNHIMPLAIDADVFKLIPKIRRIPKSVVNAAGKLHSNKGLMPIISFANTFPDYHIDIYSESFSGLVQLFKNIPNVTLYPKVKNEELPRIYNQSEFLVHLPTTFGAGERVILEAALCGCKIIANEMSGHNSWDWINKDIDVDVVRTKVTRATYEFWRVIGDLLKNKT